MNSLDNHLDINALVEMGFSKERVEQALNATNNKGIQPAIEWLFSHPVADKDSGQVLGSGSSDTPEKTGSNVDPETTDKPTAAGTGTGDASQLALSLVCEDCGKQLRSETDVQTHAARTGHQNFAESSAAIKPLTEEEKVAQRQRLQEKLQEKRNLRIEEEKQQAKMREKTRRKTGQEISKAKEEHAQLEMKRLAEERRKEKLEEKRLRQKLKEQIAKDRADFKAKSQTTPSPVKTAEPAPQVHIAKKEYDTCRIQFRLTNGSSLNANFKTDSTLNDVRQHISDNRNDDNLPSSLSTTFPRRTFTESDMSKTVKELGLVPSAVLVLGKM
ncbi:UBX domain-containing protein 1-A-like [Hydractinia symbiolongicarpus]|uniref:UBX domain-containing protein 1-A-like n=1 Tax=Hydractinia symbiolongicarpus TaxID=13093 RepID=UPI0025509DE8|nr:UBX domain-containing protein 1-A-like [Hydractinia symbiolongicarpus]